MRVIVRVALVGLVAVTGRGNAQVPKYTGPKFEKTRLADSVYAFVFDNPLGPAVDGTALVIINDADVVVVDAQNTPWAARGVLAEIRKMTRNPVRYVITTHWHGDHWQRDHAYLDLVVSLLQSTLDQTRDAVGKGLDLEATRKAVNLDSLRLRFTNGDVAKTRAFNGYFAQPAVERAWLEARGELDRTPERPR